MKRLLHTYRLSAADLLIAAILVFVPFHAFLTLWLSTLVGHFTALRLWDEVLLSVVVLIVANWLLRDGKLRTEVFQSRLVRLIGLYASLSILLGLAAFMRHGVTAMALLYGLTINLRFLAWFVVVWIVARRSSWLSSHWQWLVFWPLVVVVGFGLLQFFVLPPDFLTHFGYNGYGASSFVSYTTINQDSTTIRVQSFLRGANPLGAYLAPIAAIVAAMALRARRQWYLWLLLVGTLLALFLSFSRSGWGGAIIALVVLSWLWLPSRRARLVAAVSLGVGIIIIGSALFALRNNGAIQDALLHVSSHSTATHTSNEGHYSSLADSAVAIMHQPLGDGPGTSGQASWYNTGHPIHNTESYFLQLGEEVGLPGLVIFFAILFGLGQKLLRRRQLPLALGIFAGLLGLLFINQFSYGWTDDTLAFVWWGLAGIALALPEKQVDDTQPVA